MVFPILGANTESAAYEISNSLRFNDDDSPDLRLALGSSASGSNTNGTFSFWIKRGSIAAQQILYNHYVDANNYFRINLRANDAGTAPAGLEIINVSGGSDAGSRMTNRVFRDVSAWYHIVVSTDSDNSTNEDRVKLYINGTRYTDWASTATWDSTFKHFNDNTTVFIGTREGSSQYYDGYITEVNVIDGVEYDASFFGEFNTNGVWVPKAYTGTYGNNGHFLQFKQTGTSANSSGIGADTSGNDKHFTVTNLAATDIVTDTCTNNYAVMNLLTAGADEPEMREGNLQQYAHGTSDSAGIAPTIMPDKGKWYVELYLESPSGGDYPFFGIVDQRNLNQKNANGSKMAAGFEIDGATNNQSNTFLGSITNTNTGWPTFADNDIVQFALDLDNRKLWIGRNGTYINSGNPASGSNEQLSWTLSTAVGVMMLGYDGGGGGGAQSVWNFGQDGSFAGKATAQGNADGNSYGDFYYSPPSGYYALNTKNLAEYG
tara:strand:+ start:3733 stop:5199 length:1467 start_codon:yes stop_codon:yes gene_type:complete